LGLGLGESQGLPAAGWTQGRKQPLQGLDHIGFQQLLAAGGMMGVFHPQQAANDRGQQVGAAHRNRGGALGHVAGHDDAFIIQHSEVAQPHPIETPPRVRRQQQWKQECRPGPMVGVSARQRGGNPIPVRVDPGWGVLRQAVDGLVAVVSPGFVFFVQAGQENLQQPIISGGPPHERAQVRVLGRQDLPRSRVNIVLGHGPGKNTPPGWSLH
jgi:hypothetical protein